MITTSPGHHLYRWRDGTWRYAGPHDTFVRVSGPDDVLRRLQHDAATTGVRQGTGDGVYDELADALLARGVLAAAPASPGVLRVHVDGRTPVADELRRLLADGGAVVLGDDGPLDSAAVAAADAVVTCAAWLPDTRWCDVARWCAEHATAWHGCYLEGTSHVVGPMWLPGRTASYLDVRGRRLAAAATPDELQALWRHLESGDPRPDPVWDGPSSAMAAALVCADLQAFHRGLDLPALNHQLVLDLGSGRLDRHPVLPLPVTS